MSALALCSRHECCWHTHQRLGEERAGWCGGDTEEKIDGTKKEERIKTERHEEVGVCPQEWDVTQRALGNDIHFVMFP